MAITPIQPCPGAYGAGPLLVEAPQVLPYQYGAISAFTVLNDGDDHGRNGITYKSPACQAGVEAWVDDCDAVNILPKPVTDEDRDAIVRGCPFHLITNLSCKTTTLEAMWAEAREVFALGEQRAVEEQVWINILAQPDVTVLNPVPGPDGSVSLAQGLAYLESSIAECYGGQATIHGDRGLGIYAARDHLLERQGAGLFTPLGSKWALYAGAPNTGPDGVPAPAGYAWLYATSNVTLRRFTTDVRPDSVDHILQIGTNVPQLLVERTYVPSRECCAFAVLVCISC